MNKVPNLEAACMSHSPSLTLDTAAVQGKVFRAAAAQLAAAVADYDPTLVVYFGPDHLRALADISPCFTLAESANGFGDWNTPTDAYRVPSTDVRALVDHLLNNGIDVAVAKDIRLDHGFSLTMRQIFCSLDSVKVIPIVINCVGSPLARMNRVSALGRSVRTFLNQYFGSDERILVIASGGLSHSPPNMTIENFVHLDAAQKRAAFLHAQTLVLPRWDKEFLNKLQSEDWESLEHIENHEIAVGGPGANELRCWVAAAFTVNAPMQLVGYEAVAEWITGMGVVATHSLLNPSE